MTAKPELLPLPEADDSVENRAQWPIVIDSDVWLQGSVQSYARAVAEHNVRFLTHELANAECVIDAEQAGRKKAEAEVEALREEVDGARRVCDEVSSLLEKLETTYTCDSIVIDKCWRLLEEVTGD